MSPSGKRIDLDSTSDSKTKKPPLYATATIAKAPAVLSRSKTSASRDKCVLCSIGGIKKQNRMMLSHIPLGQHRLGSEDLSIFNTSFTEEAGKCSVSSGSHACHAWYRYRFMFGNLAKPLSSHRADRVWGLLPSEQSSFPRDILEKAIPGNVGRFGLLTVLDFPQSC
ncbi:hypothetical protein LZ30DRAFT_200853 [Colletotrichum cereale]|nr:hypothetical protein LZ30DRAFT_200853 [Colletotrichum cereale]